MTKSMSRCRGFSIPWVTPVLVISLKVTRLLSPMSTLRIWARCQEIASPSRSGSVARMTPSLSAAMDFSCRIRAVLPGISTYRGLKP